MSILFRNQSLHSIILLLAVFMLFGFTTALIPLPSVHAAPTASSDISGSWHGYGTYNNGQDRFDMVLTFTQINGSSFSGTLAEGVYESEVAITGSITSTSDTSSTITFTDPSRISGDKIALNCTYTATVSKSEMNGFWRYPDHSSWDGTISLSKIPTPPTPEPVPTPSPPPPQTTKPVEHRCGTYPMHWSFTKEVDLERVKDDLRQHNWGQAAHDVLGHHFYLWVDYRQDSALNKHRVHDKTLDVWFAPGESSDQVASWGNNFNNTTRYGMHTYWVFTHLPHFFFDDWELSDSTGCGAM